MPRAQHAPGNIVRPGRRAVKVQVASVLKHVPASQLRTLPNSEGAYVIVGRSGRRYVGSSNTARARVQAHKVKNDPNVREPIASVCCYLATRHMDARILEHWLIREIGPELNRACPGGAAAAGAKCRDCCETGAARSVDVGVHVTTVMEGLPAADAGTVPLGPGAYVLTTGSGKQYVGSSSSLRGRIRTHLDAPQHPNLDGPVRLVSCYETATEADAPILEYALIRDLAPALNRENQPDASEWKDGHRERLVAGATEALGKLQATLSGRILREVGGREVFRKSWVTYQISAMKNFCAVKLLADCLQVDLKVDERTFSDPSRISEPVVPTQAWTFNRRLRIRDEADIDGAIPLVAQAHRFLAR